MLLLFCQYSKRFTHTEHLTGFSPVCFRILWGPRSVRNYTTLRIVPWLRETARVSLKPSRRTQSSQGRFRSVSLKPSLRFQPLRVGLEKDRMGPMTWPGGGRPEWQGLVRVGGYRAWSRGVAPKSLRRCEVSQDVVNRRGKGSLGRRRLSPIDPLVDLTKSKKYLQGF